MGWGRLSEPLQIQKCPVTLWPTSLADIRQQPRGCRHLLADSNSCQVACRRRLSINFPIPFFKKQSPKVLARGITGEDIPNCLICDCCKLGLTSLVTSRTSAHPAPTPNPIPNQPTTVLYSSFTTMISDDDLYRLALFLGSAAMVLIVAYHYIEINADDNQKVPTLSAGKQAATQK